MKISQIIYNQSKLSELSNIEKKTTFGGDRFSRAVFYYAGVAFEYLDRAAQRGAPPTRQQFR